MSMQLFLWVATILGFMVPFAVERYLRSLPVAPSCPDCRAVTRALARRSAAWQLLLAQVPITLSECGRCGWTGRMRWRWARRPVLDDRR